MTSKMTIGKKLFLSFGGVLLLTMIVSFVALQSLGSLEAGLDRIMNKVAKKQYLACTIDTEESNALAAERGLTVRALTKEQALMEKNNQDFAMAMENMKTSAAEIVPLIETDDGRRDLAELKKGMDKMQQNHQQLYALAASGKTSEAAAFLGQGVASDADAVAALTKSLVQQQNRMMADEQKSSQASVSQSRWLTTIIIGFSLLVAVVVVFIVRQVNRDLRQAVTELSEGAGQTASAASQVSSSSQSLAQGSSEQAASLEETSASSEEINSMAQKNTENSKTASVEMAKAAQLIGDSNTRLADMVASMKDITDSSSKISKIIKVIDEIAFQTNILALNAAVEAARAGEAGMGFAVVADEVRNLAQRCAQAAKDTAALIEESIEKSTVGGRNLGLVVDGIQAITASATLVKTLVDEVNLGSQEQARGIEQVGKAIVQMEQVTQTTAANAEESAAAAEELNAQSEALNHVVERLTAMVGGGEAAHAQVRPVRRRAAAANGKSFKSAGEPAAGLTALRKAVSHQTRTEGRGVPVLAAHDAGRDSFPLDEDFN